MGSTTGVNDQRRTWMKFLIFIAMLRNAGRRTGFENSRFENFEVGEIVYFGPTIDKKGSPDKAEFISKSRIAEPDTVPDKTKGDHDNG